MAESFLVTRNGRLCLPVKKEYKSKIPGSTIDRSSSGSTVFIEPETIARMQDEIEDSGLRRTARRGVSCTQLMDRIAMEEDGFKENLALLAKTGFCVCQRKAQRTDGRQGTGRQ